MGLFNACVGDNFRGAPGSLLSGFGFRREDCEDFKSLVCLLDEVDLCVFFDVDDDLDEDGSLSRGSVYQFRAGPYDLVDRVFVMGESDRGVFLGRILSYLQYLDES